MKYTGPIYRPPIEANTLLLQVTVGCSHNSCTFCTMYKNTQFKIEQIDQIEKDLQEAKQTYGLLKRIFLLNADAFVLSAKKLKEIASKIVHYYLALLISFISILVIVVYSSQNSRILNLKSQDILMIFYLIS